jgi:membrane-associated phospholipid phosphatase
MKTGPAQAAQSAAAAPAAMRRWVLARLVTETWTELRTQLGAIAPKHWWLWGAGLAAGFATCALLVFLVTEAAKSWDGLATLDARALRWLIAMAPMAFADAIMYESPGNLLYLGPLTLLVTVWSVRRGRALIGISLVVGYLLQRPLVLLGWTWWDRARPELVAGGIASPAYHSFPSGHAALATFVYGFLAWLWARSTYSLAERVFVVLCTAAWITLIGVGRLRLGAHWPSDMVAGLIISLPWLAIVIFLHRYLEARR